MTACGPWYQPGASLAPGCLHVSASPSPSRVRSPRSIVTLLLVGASLHAPAAAVPDLAATQARIVELTNELRVKQGRAAVRADATLSATAQAYAAHLARVGQLTHTADGRRPYQRAAARGYAWCIVRENIAYRFDSAGFTSDALARQLMDGWINSAGHRANLLAPQVRDIGVALARSNSGRYYAVQMFGRADPACAGGTRRSAKRPA